MKKIKEWFMGSNHYKHVLGAFLVALGNLLVMHTLSASFLICAISTLYTSFAVGIAMGFKDKQGGGEFSYQDQLADAGGYLIAMLMFILFTLW